MSAPSFTVRENVAPALEMLYAIAGGEENFRARPFVSNSNCFVVPPMKFAEDACGVLEACVEGGMPILLLSAGQAGATAPAAIAGAVVQAVAEVLAGLVYVNALKPGHPAIFGTWPFVSDLRTGAMSGGSAEQALLTAACAQMAQFYDLPGGSAAGMADSKLPDIQSGYEKGITNVMAGLSGLNLVYESAGMHASLLGFCLESLIIDNDMLGHCQRCVRGIEVTDAALSIDTIAEVCLERPRPLSRQRADAAADADRIFLSRRRRPLLAQGMEREGQARHPAAAPSPRRSGSSPSASRAMCRRRSTTSCARVSATIMLPRSGMGG